MEQAAASGWRGSEAGEPEWEAMELEAAPAIFAADGSSSRSPAESIFVPDLPDWGVLSDDLLPDLSQMEDIFHPAHEDEIQQDERDLDKWLRGESCSLTMKDTVTVQTPPDPILNLLEFIPKDGCRCGLRGARKRLTLPLKLLCFGTTKEKRCHLRKNNDHWTMKEVIELVKGVSMHGVGRWTELKRDYFSTSIRTPVHLKDKWRNLLKSCGIEVTFKTKGKAQKTMLQPLDKSLIEQIRLLACKHPYPRQNH